MHNAANQRRFCPAPDHDGTSVPDRTAELRQVLSSGGYSTAASGTSLAELGSRPTRVVPQFGENCASDSREFRAIVRDSVGAANRYYLSEFCRELVRETTEAAERRAHPPTSLPGCERGDRAFVEVSGQRHACCNYDWSRAYFHIFRTPPAGIETREDGRTVTNWGRLRALIHDHRTDACAQDIPIYRQRYAEDCRPEGSDDHRLRGYRSIPLALYRANLLACACANGDTGDVESRYGGHFRGHGYSDSCRNYSLSTRRRAVTSDPSSTTGEPVLLRRGHPDPTSSSSSAH